MRSNSASATPPCCVRVKTISAPLKMVPATVTPEDLKSGMAAARLGLGLAMVDSSVRTRVAKAKEGAVGSGAVGSGVCAGA